MKTRVALSHPKSLLLEAFKPPVQGVQQGKILACVVSSVGCWPRPFRLEMWLPPHVLPVVTLICPLQPPHPMLPLAVTPHPTLLRTLRQVGSGERGGWKRGIQECTMAWQAGSSPHAASTTWTDSCALQGTRIFLLTSTCS